MMSASEGGGGSWKSKCSKGGSVNFILQIRSKCGRRGERVKKSENFADVISVSSLSLCCVGFVVFYRILSNSLVLVQMLRCMLGEFECLSVCQVHCAPGLP